MIADHLPDYDVRDIHSVTIAAAPGTVMEAVRNVTSREVPLLVALMAIRTVPAVLRGRRRPTARGPLLEGLRASGFVALADAERELVLGSVGRFWRPTGDVREIEASAFRDFAEPGWAKGAISFRVEPQGARTVLTTETRVAATDASARRRFRRYWRLIQAGSAAIRIDWLRAIRRRAERAARSER